MKVDACAIEPVAVLATSGSQSKASSPSYNSSTMASRPISSWVVPLKGHAYDLEELPIYLDGSPVTVVKRGDEYFLQLSSSVAGQTCERVGELAVDFLAVVNGAASVLIAGYRPIELEGGTFYGLNENGEVVDTVVQLRAAEVRCKAGHVTVAIDGAAQPDHRKGSMSSILREALHNRAKADALRLVGRSTPSWAELYLVFELVEANVGRRMFDDGWISQAEAKLFTRTANSYTALGTAGRHGKDRGHPPTEPMQQQAAVTLMRALVAAWVRETSATSFQSDG